MAKYHINKHGIPAVCEATKEPCPLGPHFETEALANEYIQDKMSKEFNVLATTPSIKDSIKEQVDLIKNTKFLSREHEEMERTKLAELSLESKGSYTTTDNINNILGGIHTPDSGATFSLNKGDFIAKVPQVGFCASPYPEYSKVFESSKEVTSNEILDYIDSMSEIDDSLLEDEDTYIGLWNDPDTGKVYLDISKRYDTAEEARVSCENNDQIAYFDLQLFQSVDVDRTATSGQS